MGMVGLRDGFPISRESAGRLCAWLRRDRTEFGDVAEGRDDLKFRSLTEDDPENILNLRRHMPPAEICSRGCGQQRVAAQSVGVPVDMVPLVSGTSQSIAILAIQFQFQFRSNSMLGH